MKKILSSLLIILFFMIGLRVTAVAATGDVYNIVTCPGEDMSTEIQINFQSPTSITGLQVEYTVATDTAYANSSVVNATSKELSRQDTASIKYEGFSTPRNVWNAKIENLTPETEYIYRVVKGNTKYSSDYKFKTASQEDKTFSFLFMTDPQYYNSVTASKFNVMAEYHLTNSDIDFAFITGDISDKGGNSSYWDLFYQQSSLQKMMFSTTVGNHEYYDKGTTTVDNSIYNNFFYNPQNGPKSVLGSSYYFLYNNALFIMLDSEVKGKLTEQQEWFRYICNSIPASYIIVGTHRSCYAGAEYYQDGQLYLSQWGSVFDECAIDLVLSGHDHMYARTYPLYNDQITEEPYTGTTYILGGSAGTKYYSQKSDANESKWAQHFDGKTCCSVITLGEKNLKVTTYDIDNNIHDTFTQARKRFGEIDPNYTKEEFESTIKVENAMPDFTSGSISWTEKGYGLVKSITCTNLNSEKRLGSVVFINNSATSLNVKGDFWIGEVNQIKVDILYKDDTTKSIILELDNRIEWGSIKNLRIEALHSAGITFSWEQDINLEIDYVDRFRILRDGVIMKNITCKASDLEQSKYVVELPRGLKPETEYTFEVMALNINGTAIWSETVVVTTPRELSEEEYYQRDMANVAIKALIDNLLTALGQ